MARADRIQRLEQLRYQRRGSGRLGGNHRLGPTLLSLVLLGTLLAVSSQFFIIRFSSALSPAVATATHSRVVTFEIKQGDTLDTVSARLAAQGIIPNATIFSLYAKLKQLDTNLEPGIYKVHTNDVPDKIIADLTPVNSTARTVAGTSSLAAIKTIRVGFPEGLRIEEIAQKLADKHVVDAKTFISQARHADEERIIAGVPTGWDTSYYTFLKGRPPGASLEGYLFPQTYDFAVYTDTVTTARQAIGQMLDEFRTQVKPDTLSAFKKEFKTTDAGTALYKGITMASLVQREGQVAEELPKIAAVYMNRITLKGDTSGFLGVDAAQRYALGYDKVTRSWWATITPADYTKATPYNTFNPQDGRSGLPFGPIANPGLAAIKAAAHPQKDWPYFYYVAKGDGSGTHAFAMTNAEFESLKCSLGYC